jgi:hypothetical protein
MLSFNNLVLYAFIIRLIIVLYGLYKILLIIGNKENLDFFQKYFELGFIDGKKILSWIIAIFSIIYFEHLVSNAQKISISIVFDKHFILSLYVVLALLGIIIYSIINTKNNIKESYETKKEIDKAIKYKNITETASILSLFVPGGVLVKFGIFGISKIGGMIIDNEVKKTLKEQTKQLIFSMLIIALINLSIITISTYLITEKIFFW